uniref:Anoctamin n=1 Tax=Romanomermis culicivorax TaxID=13658 RepID=A0A915JIL9_ROMCU
MKQQSVLNEQESMALTSDLSSSTQDEIKINKSSMYFADGERKIDYVLVYEINNDNDEYKRESRRAEFEKNLLKRGLHLEYTTNEEEGSTNRTVFMKIHAPWDVLTSQAELLRIKMPIKCNDIRIKRKTSAIRTACNATSLCEIHNEEFDEPDYFTAVFNRKMVEQFVITDRNTFFKGSQRSRMVWDILIRTSYDSSSSNKVGINKLINSGVFTGAYPLHSGFYEERVKNEKGKVVAKKTSRQALYDYWAKPSKFMKYQPLWLIKSYFGEKIAIYFAWLGFYTWFLIPAALLGFICIVYGGLSLSSDIPSNDICNKTGVGSIVMCPNCDHKCETWKLTVSCFYSQITHVFDNWFTVIFAVCMSIWATLFLEFWKRRQAVLAWDWDLTDFELEEDVIRPEYEAGVKTKAKNPITQLCLVLVFVFGVIVYRIIVEYWLKNNEHVLWRGHASLITSFTGASLNLICIIILGRIYQYLAWRLTEWEYPRTESQFEDSYTFKVFMFEFINYNSSLFYIAFFKGKFSTVPNNKLSYIFGYPQEACDPAGCMVELVIQLSVIMIGKQFLNNCLEILFPIMSNKWRHYMAGSKRRAPRWEQDYQLQPAPPMQLFDEYLEMVLQFGFITLFVSAFPLAPLFAFLNNIMEIRLDAYKFVVAFRRPRPARARDLGIWYGILDGVSKIAVVCNACVIAFTSDFVPRMVYQLAYSVDNSLYGYIENKLAYYDLSEVSVVADNRTYCRYMDYRNPPCSLNATLSNDYWSSSMCQCDVNNSYQVCIKWWHILAAKFAFVLAFEHFVFGLKGLFAYAIPDVPEKVRVQIQRETYLAKQAFFEHEMLKNSVSRDVNETSSATGQISGQRPKSFFNENTKERMRESKIHPVQSSPENEDEV